jgi:hypothetical protein
MQQQPIELQIPARNTGSSKLRSADLRRAGVIL